MAYGLMVVKSNTEMMEEERKEDKSKIEAALSYEEADIKDRLSVYIRDIWDEAKMYKTDISEQMLKSIRQRNNEYEADKIAAITQIKGPMTYAGITNTKCRAGEAWVRDIIFQPGVKPYAIKPTPVPELPEEMTKEVQERFMKEALTRLITQAADSGQSLDTTTLMQNIRELQPEFEKRIKRVIMQKAKEKCAMMEDQVDDQLVEGGFYEALNEAIYDIVTFKAGFVKGPTLRKDRVRKVKTDTDTGRMQAYVEERLIPQFERVDPFDIFPARGSRAIDDGDLFERTSLWPKEVAGLIGMPGFNDDEIKIVLEEYKNGGLVEWTDEASVRYQEQTEDVASVNAPKKIDVLIFWGAVQGQMLIDWGLDPKKVKDTECYYETCCYLIGRHVIKAVMNLDPLGKKPYSKASFEEIPGSFWGRGVPELIMDIQDVCNAVVRAIVQNIGIASGPQVERNIDRVPEYESREMWPWKVWDVTDSQMSSAPALKFYQPPMVVEKLIQVFTTFSKMADEYSGIPAYAHGDPKVGGGGDTASGLSMLITQAARGIKQVIKNMDNGPIKGCVERQFYYNIEQKEYRGLIGDIKVVAMGSQALVAKEQLALRLTEYGRATANPYDMQILGYKGRKYILKEIARNIGLDAEEISEEPLGKQTLQIPEIAPLAGPRNLDVAGNPAQGKATARFNQGATAA